MPSYPVGSPYLPGRRSLAPGTNYSYRQGQHELLLLLDRPTRAEIEAVRHGEARFALCQRGQVLFLLYRFGGAIDWSDCPFSPWLVPEEQRTVPEEVTSETHALLTTLLVDASRNIIEAIRVTSFSPHFTRVLHGAIRRQLEQPLSREDYERTIDEAYRHWPVTYDMLRDAIAQTKGGE